MGMHVVCRVGKFLTRKTANLRIEVLKCEFPCRTHSVHVYLCCIENCGVIQLLGAWL